ncbi:hypothetical protein HPB47_016369 [Ixodes persulcatus]|uniref:Uncharacterized protein n=1 Tax=Ixodes persulcatus TaxID=34615 RepID=A0AC60QR40_IXOPE|nr:hypothetical protein HPB47_016369 [Ixodes persulcatus]
MRRRSDSCRVKVRSAAPGSSGDNWDTSQDLMVYVTGEKEQQQDLWLVDTGGADQRSIRPNTQPGTERVQSAGIVGDPTQQYAYTVSKVLWVGMLAAFDNVMGDRANNSYLYLVDCIMVFLQLVNILHVGLASWEGLRSKISHPARFPAPVSWFGVVCRKHFEERDLVYPVYKTLGAAAMPECQAPSSSDRRGTAAQGTDPESLGTLTHQMLKFRAASGFLMAQTYLSTVLLFSGFYLIIYRLDAGSRIGSQSVSPPAAIA